MVKRLPIMGKQIRRCGHLTNDLSSRCAECKRNETRKLQRAAQRLGKTSGKLEALAPVAPILPKVAPSGIPSKSYVHAGFSIHFRPETATFSCIIGRKVRVTKSLDSMKVTIDREKGKTITPFYALSLDYLYGRPPRITRVRVVGVERLTFSGSDNARWVVELPKRSKGANTIRAFREYIWPDTEKARKSIKKLAALDVLRTKALDRIKAAAFRAEKEGGQERASFDSPRLKAPLLDSKKRSSK